MNIGEKLNRKGDKVFYFYDYGRKPGQRPSIGVFTYVNPMSPEQQNFNREALKILETKKNQRIVEQQVIGTPYISSFKFKENFLDYYDEYVQQNKREGNRHLPNSYTHFKNFQGKDFIPWRLMKTHVSVSGDLLDNFNGDTPSNYYSHFKWVIKPQQLINIFSPIPLEKL